MSLFKPTHRSAFLGGDISLRCMVFVVRKSPVLTVPAHPLRCPGKQVVYILDRPFLQDYYYSFLPMTLVIILIEQQARSFYFAGALVVVVTFQAYRRSTRLVPLPVEHH